MSRLNPNGFLNGGGDYRDFIFYKKTKVLYDMTYWYQNHYLVKGDRTKDQMEQAARSGKQNIAEGHADGMTSLEMELKLVNTARGSLIELREDYEDQLRVNELHMWDKSHPRYEKMVQFCYHHHNPEDYRPYYAHPSSG